MLLMSMIICFSMALWLQQKYSCLRCYKCHTAIQISTPREFAYSTVDQLIVVGDVPHSLGYGNSSFTLHEEV